MKITITASLLQTLIDAASEAEAIREYDADEAHSQGQTEEARENRSQARRYARAQLQAMALLKTQPE
jgi:hypothetical protein